MDGVEVGGGLDELEASPIVMVYVLLQPLDSTVTHS